MPIVFLCPEGHRLSVAERAAGREIRCLHCGTTVRVPAASTVAEQDAAQTPPSPPKPTQPPPVPSATGPSTSGAAAEELKSAPKPATPSAPAPPMVDLPAPPVPAAAATATPAAPPAVAPPLPPVPELPPPIPPRPGYRCSPSERSGVLGIVFAMGAVAFALAAPACYEITQHWSATASSGIARWAFVLLLLALVQAAYATYVWQAPDWGSVLAVAMLELSVAMGLAFVFGLLLAGRSEHSLVQWLGMTEALRSDLARLWCFFALAATSGAAFWSGRYGFAWRRRLAR